MSADQARSPVAVVGMACRLPGANNAVEFWRALIQGRDLVDTVPPDRWDASQHPKFVSDGAFLDDVIGLDNGFFSISESEAAFMCPQQRLLLELAWHALEHAGIAPSKLENSGTGVFVGLCGHDFSIQRWQQSESLYLGTGTSNAVAANRISFHFGLNGPSLAVDAACASSLTAIHLACRSIADGECDQALAGSANVLLLPEVTSNLAASGVISTRGRCHSFGADADGYVRSEGAAMIVLKRLDLAERDGDRILGVILASGVNHNGRSNGLTAPNPNAQAQLIKRCIEDAGIHPRAIDYVEAAATGTRIGDAIEVKALKDSLLDQRSGSSPLIVGSVKSNLGHLEGTGGIIGLIKALLCIQHGEIPQSLHSRQLNPMCQIDAANLLVPQSTVRWDRTLEDRIAAVSSFGFGGSNAHILLRGVEPKPVAAPNLPQPIPTWQLMAISAKSASALESMRLAVHDQLADADSECAHALAASAALDRDHHRHRLSVAFQTVEALRDGLLASAAIDTGQRRTICLALDDQVTEMTTIWAWLYRHQPEFTRMVDDVSAELPVHASVSRWLLVGDIAEGAEFLTRVALNYCIASWLQSVVQAPLAFQVDPTGEVATVALLCGLKAADLPALCDPSAALRLDWKRYTKRLPVYRSHQSNQPWQHLLTPGQPDPVRMAVCQVDDLAVEPERFLVEVLGLLYRQGAKLNWSVLYPKGSARHADLPMYPFQRQRHWPTPSNPPALTRQTPKRINWTGDLIPLPMLHQKRRQYRLDPSKSAVLADHVIAGHLILSAAAQIGLVATALFDELPKAQKIVLSDVRFLAPTFMDPNGDIAAQLVIDASDPDRGAITLLTTSRSDPSNWQQVLTCGYSGALIASAGGLQLPQQGMQPIPADFYAHMDRAGYHYGASYRWLQREYQHLDVTTYELWVAGDCDTEGMPWHPGLLDSCFHAIARQAALPSGDRLRLPASIAQIDMQRRPAPVTAGAVQLNRILDASGPTDLRLHDADGATWITMKDVRFTTISRAALTQFERANLTANANEPVTDEHPERWLRDTVSRVLGTPVESEHDQLPLPSLGFDSLKAMELQGYLRRRFQTELGVAQLLSGLSFSALVEQLCQAPTMPSNSPIIAESSGATIDIESFERTQRDALVEIEL